MLLNYSNTDIVSAMRENFLRLNRNGDFLDISLFKKKCVVYVIENLLTHKIYIGKTVDLLNRANQYTYICRNQDEFINNPSKVNMRPIEIAICNEGILNFRMYPLAIANDRIELAQMEKDFIIQYNSTDPNIGYNELIPTGNDYIPKVKLNGTPQSIPTKMKKAKLVACIDPDNKVLFISVGMKIFGDYIGSSKDQVKNCAKRAIRHRGFYIIYLNDVDRLQIKNKIYSKWNNFEISKARLIQAGGTFGGYSHNKYNDYLSMVSNIEIVLDDRSAARFSESGYKCYFLTYSEDKSTSYKIADISTFFDLIKD